MLLNQSSWPLQRSVLTNRRSKRNSFQADTWRHRSKLTCSRSLSMTWWRRSKISGKVHEAGPFTHVVSKNKFHARTGCSRSFFSRKCQSWPIGAVRDANCQTGLIRRERFLFRLLIRCCFSAIVSLFLRSRSYDQRMKPTSIHLFNFGVRLLLEQFVGPSRCEDGTGTQFWVLPDLNLQDLLSIASHHCCAVHVRREVTNREFHQARWYQFDRI
mmetsp:Transcript_29775/g.81779  ORF Transcript_29775/g.81779 Transcript_29775/m.81779 type:complete len:214 (-) Transcript_29775:221-862(-)